MWVAEPTEVAAVAGSSMETLVAMGFVEADCTSVDDDGVPTSAEPRLRGDALAAACRRRAANRTACPAPRGAPFGLACWR